MPPDKLPVNNMLTDDITKKAYRTPDQPCAICEKYNARIKTDLFPEMHGIIPALATCLTDGCHNQWVINFPAQYGLFVLPDGFNVTGSFNDKSK